MLVPHLPVNLRILGHFQQYFSSSVLGVIPGALQSLLSVEPGEVVFGGTIYRVGDLIGINRMQEKCLNPHAISVSCDIWIDETPLQDAQTFDLSLF